MMLPAYQDPLMQRRLLSVALSWIGTPFRPHADIKGAGVDCVHLAASIYAESGFVFEFKPPTYTLDGGRHIPLSKMVSWLERSKKFRLVMGQPAAALIGDALLFKMGKGVEHHCGIKITASTFIHAIRRHGVIESNLADATWAARLSLVYRPFDGVFMTPEQG